MGNTTTSDATAQVTTQATAPSAAAVTVVAPVAAATDKPPAEPAADASKAAASRALLKEQEATRKLNVERAALAAEKTRIAKDAEVKSEAMVAEYKADPIAFGEKHGTTYEDLTKRVIANAGKNTPEARIAALEAERKAEKEAADQARLASAAATTQAQTQQQINAYVETVHAHAKTGVDAFELLNTVSAEIAKQLIFETADRMADESKTIPTAQAVCEAVEARLLEFASPLTKTKKVAALLTPKQEAAVAEKEKAEAAAGPVEDAIAAQKKRITPRTPPKNLTNKAAAAPTPVANAPATRVSYKDREKLIAQIAADARKAAG